MKEVTEIYYLSEDGRRFETKEQCIEWENRKHYMDIKNLSNEQIIGFLSKIFYFLDEKYYTVRAQLEIKEDRMDGSGITFRIKYYDTESREERNYKGHVFGYNNVDILIEHNDIFWSLKDAYEYLQQIGFFKEYDIEPTENLDISNDYKLILKK